MSTRWSTTRIEIEINPADLKTDTFRASGAGGQHVNKTEIGRALHPHPDRHRRRLHPGPQPAPQPRHRHGDAEGAAVRAGAAQARGGRRDAVEAGKTDIGWGHQIRSYVLQPYQMVKDLRTGVEKGNPAAVLDGDLDEFMAAALAPARRRHAVRGQRPGGVAPASTAPLPGGAMLRPPPDREVRAVHAGVRALGLIALLLTMVPCLAQAAPPPRCPDLLLGDSLAVGMGPAAPARRASGGRAQPAPVSPGCGRQAPRCVDRLLLVFGTNDLRGLTPEAAQDYVRQISR